MDANKLIDTVNQLNNKLKDLDHKTAIKRQELSEINNNVSRSQQQLEKKAKELAELVENKLQQLHKIDDELLKQRSLLARMNGGKTPNQTNQNQTNHMTPQVAVNNVANMESNRHESSEDAPKGSIMENSLEDFIAQQFEKEFLVKYPKEPSLNLNERDFDKVLVIIREKMTRVDDPSIVVNDYLSSYSQTLNKDQIEILKKELNPFKK